MKLKVKKLHPDAKLPTRAYGSPAGWDLYCYEDSLEALPGIVHRIRTGIAVEIPEGYFGMIADRSGMAYKAIKVVGGILDNDFRGEVSVMLNLSCNNINKDNLKLSKNERIAQLLILPVPEIELEEVEELSVTERGDKGFGSSG